MGWQDAPLVEEAAPAAAPAWAAAPVVDAPAAAPKNPVGLIEAGLRGAGEGFAGTGQVLGLAASQAARFNPAIQAVNAIVNRVRGTDTPVAERVFSGIVDPAKEAVRSYAPRQDEAYGLPEHLSRAGGMVASMLPTMVAGGKAQAATMMPRLLGDLTRGAVVAQPAFAVPQTVLRADQLLEAGVAPGDVAKASVVNWLANTAQGAAPLSVPGGLVKRVATGAGINVLGGAAGRAAEAEALGPENARVHQQPFSLEQTPVEAIFGGAMAGAMGPRPVAPIRIPKRPEITTEPGATGWRPPEVDPQRQNFDPAEQVKQVQAALYGVPDGAPEAPAGMKLVPLRAPTLDAPQPDVSDVPVRVAPDWQTEGKAREPAREPGMDAQGREIPPDADAAFKIAEAQRQRKQAAQDEAALQGQSRDLREARAGGSTSQEGTAATAPQAFTFLDVKRGRDGKVIGTGPEVEIQGEATAQGPNGKPVPGYRVSYTVDGPNGPERVFEVVPQSRVGTLERPANPRFAQDVAATAYTPPKGVGTESPPQPAPRTAAQRIGTEPSPEFIPGERQAVSPGEPPAPRRAPETYDPAEVMADRALPRPAEPIPPERQIGGVRTPLDEQPAARAEGGDASPRAGENGARFLTAIIKAGGIDPKDAPDMVGERGAQANRMRPGLFRKGGLSGDGLREWLVDNGYMTDAEVARADRELPGGAIEVAMERVRSALRGEGQRQAGDEEVGYAAGREAKWREHEQRLRDDPAYRAEDERLRREAAQAEQIAADERQARIERAAHLDEAAVESAARRFEDDERGFDAEIERIIREGEAKRDQAPGGRGEAGEPDAVRAADAREADGAGRPDFGLEQPTEAGLRRAADERARGDAERRRVEDAPPPEDFTLSGSDRPADQAAARGQQELPGTGGTKLYAGPPLDEMAAFVADRAKAIAGDWRPAAEGLKAAVKAVADAFGARLSGEKGAERAPKGGESLPAAVARMLAYNVHSHIKAFGEAWQSPTIRRVADMIYSTAGEAQAGQSFHEALGAHVTARQGEISNIARDLDALVKAGGVSEEQVIKMVENPGSRQGKAGEIAARIADWLRAEYAYLKDAGVDIGKVKDYFPRVYDRAQIIMRRAAFEADATRAYEKMGLVGDEARDAARAFWFREAYGSDGSPGWTNAQAGGEKFAKARELTPAAAEEIRKWRVDGIADTLTGYLAGAAKRAEIARRFGDKWSGWDALEKQIIKEAPGLDADQLRELRGMVASSMGLRPSSMGVAAHTATQYLRLWTTLATMPKAALSSISETWMPIARANADIGTSLHHLRNVLYENARSLASQALGAGRTEYQQRLFDFAEDVGALSQSPLSHLMADRWMGSDVQSKRVNAISTKFFRMNLLEQVTNWQRALAVDAAQIWMRRLAKRADGEMGGGKSADFFLRELGVPADKVAGFSEWVRGMGDSLPEAGALTGEYGAMYRNALVRFADQAIQRPTAATRPSWANTEWGAVVFQLQGFANAFHKNVLLRQANLVREGVKGDYSALERAALIGGMAPGLMMAAATAGLVWELRDRMFAKDKPRERTDWAKVERAISGSGMFGALDPWVQAVGGVRYNRPVSSNAAGPALGGLEQTVSTTAQYFMNNSDKTNAAERKAADTFYQWALEPAATLALAATPAPVSPVTQALTIWAIPAGRQHFTDAVAGEKDRRREKPIRGVFEPRP